MGLWLLRTAVNAGEVPVACMEQGLAMDWRVLRTVTEDLTANAAMLGSIGVFKKHTDRHAADACTTSIAEL